MSYITKLSDEQFEKYLENLREFYRKGKAIDEEYLKREKFREISMRYERIFGEGFPNLLFRGTPPERLISMMEECMRKNKKYKLTKEQRDPNRNY